MSGFAVALELENPLRHGGHDGVMATLDVREKAGETLVVVVYFGRPDNRFVGIRVVPAKNDLSLAVCSFESQLMETHLCNGIFCLPCLLLN